MKLFVEMRKLSTRILEEELAEKNERGGEYIGRQNHHVDQEGRSVRVPEDKPVGDEELQLAHKPKTESEQNGDGDQEDVGDHRESPGQTRKGLGMFP